MVRRRVCLRFPRFSDAKNRPKAGFLFFAVRSAQFFPSLPDQVEHSLDRIEHFPRHNLPDFTQAAALTTFDKLPARRFHCGLGLLSICALPVPQMPLPSLAQSTGNAIGLARHVDFGNFYKRNSAFLRLSVKQSFSARLSLNNGKPR